ncbi:anthrone oxygenase family protein [Planomonospora sp. ID67723]|uniref:anthrone oxygenase family protein n=1 Tax=Planomonospora sp. ID67723 TaxID=2738134 RepID=UPI0027DDF01A|nr:anthrone oxygenase family protein [Planomonospora sp. ID67723]
MLFTLAALAAGLTIVLTGAMTGLFYGFSVAVMPGLDGIDARQAIPAMQSVNRKILNPVFLPMFVGTVLAAPAAGALLLALGQERAAVLFFAAAAAYVLGAFAPTAAVNVPMNNALDAADVPADPAEAARLWSGYSARWTRWNTGRAVFCGISLLLAGLAVFVWGGQG